MADIELSENVVYNNIRTVLVTARQKVYSAVNTAMVEAYWEIGRQIEQAVGNRAEYGKGLLQYISRELSAEFGKGFTVRNLQTMRQFFNAFPNTHTLCAQLSWSHYRLLIRIDDASRREFYLAECAECKLQINLPRTGTNQHEQKDIIFKTETIRMVRKNRKQRVREVCVVRSKKKGTLHG